MIIISSKSHEFYNLNHYYSEFDFIFQSMTYHYTLYLEYSMSEYLIAINGGIYAEND